MSVPVVLLGAGASIEAGLPASGQLTPQIAEWLSEHIHATCGADADAMRLAAFHSLIGMFIAHDSSKGKSPFNPVDIEKLYAALEFLQRRDELELAPFVSEWRDDYDSMVYQQLSIDIRRALRDILQPDTKERFHYLQVIFDSGVKQIATLNLDLGIELAASLNGTSISTGMDRWTGGHEWNWEAADTVRLLKLHGSIDRTLPTGDELLVGELSGTSLYPQLPAWDEGYFPPGIIFGSHGKFRPDGPFLAMWLEFRRWLSQTNELIVCGYSFRDEHINHLIIEWSCARDGRTITVIDPGLPTPQEAPTYPGDLELAEMRRSLVPAPSLLQSSIIEYAADPHPPHCPAFPMRWLSTKPHVNLVRKGAREGLRDVLNAEATTRGRS